MDDRVVMVIDDDADSRDGLCMVLEQFGFFSKAADTSAAALSLLTEGLRPCAVLLNAPSRDALNFRIRQSARSEWAAVPVVVGRGLGKEPMVLSDAVWILENDPNQIFDFDTLLPLLEELCSRPATAKPRAA